MMATILKYLTDPSIWVKVVLAAVIILLLLVLIRKWVPEHILDRVFKKRAGMFQVQVPGQPVLVPAPPPASAASKPALKKASSKSSWKIGPLLKFILGAIVLIGIAIYLQSHYRTFSVLKDLLPSDYHFERSKQSRIVTEQLATGKLSEQSAEYIQQKVDEVMAQHPEPIEAPLADDGTNSDAWSPWFEVPTVGIHGFDLNIDPGLNSGKIRMQCTVGNSAEEAEHNAHETASGDTLCGPFSWFRLNTVRTDDQIVPIKVNYFFTVKRG